MPSTYTLNNGIELIGTGEQSGTWGDTTNTNFELLDTALDGQVSVTLAATGSSGSPNTLPISDGASSNGRNRLVIFGDGGDLGGTAFVQLTPNDAEKIIYVRNNLSGSRSILLFQGTYSASNDYEVPAGTTAVVFFNGAGTGAVAANVFNNAFFDSLRLGNVSVTAILDEDDMSSDSATALATQQSIKAYVDTQITAEDLDFAGDSGTGAVDLDSQTFTIAGTTNEIETSASGQTLTVGLPDNVTISGDLTVDTDTLYVDSTNDRVGVNEATPLEALHVTTSDSGTTINKTVGSTSGPVFVLDNTDDTTNNLAAIQFASSGSSSTDVTATTGIYSINTGRGGTYSYGDLAFYTTNSGGTHTEAMRIDSSQRVLIGSTSSINGYYLQVAENSGYAGVSALRYTNDAFGAYLNLGKSRTTTIGGNTIVQDNDVVGYITFSPNDGTDLVSISSQIQGEIDGTPGANDVPGRLVFKTTADGAASSTERMRITSSGNVGIASGGDVGLDSTDIALQVGSGSFSNPTIQIRSSSSGTGQLWFGDNSGSDAGRFDGFIQYNQTDRFMYFGTAQSNALRIDSDQRTIIGGYSHTPIINASVQASVVGGSADSGSGGLGVARFGGPPVIALASSPNTTVGSFTLTSDDTAMGYIYYGADDGTDIRTAGAYIAGIVDGTPGANDMPGRLVFATTADGASSPTERMRITQNGTIGLGSGANSDAASYFGKVTVGDGTGTQGITIYSATDGAGVLAFSDGTSGSARYSGYIYYSHASNSMSFLTGAGDSAMVIDSSQRVLIGLTSDIGTNHKLQLNSDMTIMTFDGTTTGANGVRYIKSRASSPGSNAIVADGDDVGFLDFRADDGTDYATRTAVISSAVDGTPGSNDMPGRLQFYTTADGASAVTERMRIDNTGRVMIAGAAGNVNSPSPSMGDMNAYLRVGNSGAQIGTLVKYSHGPNTNVDGAVFQLRTGTNGNAAYLKITCTNYQGARESIFFANNASGTWNVTEVNVADYGGNSPNFAVTTGTTNPTVTVSLQNTSYSGGFLDVSASPSWQLTLA